MKRKTVFPGRSERMKTSVVLFVSFLALLFSSVMTGVSKAEDVFKEAHFFIEYNSSAGDAGVQVFLDDDNWRQISISDPNDVLLFTVEGQGQLKEQGLTELFFESVEPELADLPLVEFLDRFPEGLYEFEGSRNDGVDIESEVEFTHVIPCGPDVTPEEGAILDPNDAVVIGWEEVTEVVDPDATDDEGETVCLAPYHLDQELVIETYQVIVENDDIHLIVDLQADARQLTVPPELIEENTPYKFEVLVKEESGNQTITEGFFCTGPRLKARKCANLAEAL